MKEVKGKVMMYGGQFVNEYMLHDGIYSTDKPNVHWDENITIDKHIKDCRMIWDAMEIERSEDQYDNMRKCEFVDVILRVV